MSNVLQVRVNDELLDFYKGDPDKIKEALTMYKRAQDNFIQTYIKTLEK